MKLGYTRALVLAALLIYSHSNPALAKNEFLDDIKCARALEQYSDLQVYTLEKNGDRPGTRDDVGLMIQGKNAERPGFYVYRASEAYFVAFPKDAKQRVDRDYPKMEPATYIWAAIPQEAKPSATDKFHMTIQGGRVVSYSDEKGQADLKRLYSKDEKLFQEIDAITVPVKAVDAIGPESRDAFGSLLAAAIRTVPVKYDSAFKAWKNFTDRSRSEKAKARLEGYEDPEEPSKPGYLSALDSCLKAGDGKFKDDIAAAKEAIRLINPEVIPAAPADKNKAGSPKTD